MSIEENLKSIADSLKELTQIGRLNLALAAAHNSEAKTSPSTPPSSASEPVQTEPSPSPAPTESVASTRKPGRPKKQAASSPPVEPEPVVAPEPVPEPAPAVVVETRPEPDPVDDFLDEPKEENLETVYPEPTSENVRKALIDYAARHGGSEPNQGGRAKARALMKSVTGCEVMPQLEALVKSKGSTEPYADVIRAAMEG